MKKRWVLGTVFSLIVAMTGVVGASIPAEEMTISQMRVGETLVETKAKMGNGYKLIDTVEADDKITAYYFSDVKDSTLSPKYILLVEDKSQEVISVLAVGGNQEATTGSGIKLGMTLEDLKAAHGDSDRTKANDGNRIFTYINSERNEVMEFLVSDKNNRIIGIMLFL